MKSLNRQEMSSTDKFNHMNAILDDKLAHQKDLKKILNEDQYTQWKKTSHKMQKKGKGKGEQKQYKHRKGQK